MCHYFSCLFKKKTTSAYNTSIGIIEKLIVLGLRLGQSGRSSIVLLPARDNTSLAVTLTLHMASSTGLYRVQGVWP